MDRTLEDHITGLSSIPSHPLAHQVQHHLHPHLHHPLHHPPLPVPLAGTKRKLPLTEEQKKGKHKSRKPYASGKSISSFRISATLDRRIKDLLGPETTNKDCNSFILKAIDEALKMSTLFLSEFRFARVVKKSKVLAKQNNYDGPLLSGAADEEPIVPNTEASTNNEILDHVHKIVLAELKVAKSYEVVLLWNKVNRVSKDFTYESFITCLDRFDDVVIKSNAKGSDIVTLREDVDTSTAVANLPARRLQSSMDSHRQSSSALTFVALSDFVAKVPSQLSVLKGTKLMGLSCEGTQMLVRSIDTHHTGYVPLAILFGVRV